MPTAPRYNSMADFFTPDVFRAVLKDPATAIRLKAFCESSACGENIAFLEKVHSEDLSAVVEDTNHVVRLISTAGF